MLTLRIAIVALTLIAVSSVSTSGGQMPGTEQGQPPDPNRQAREDPREVQLQKQQEQMLMAARQKRLIADTAKLASLAADLKTQVDNSSTTTLPADLIKKANDIEKLAHDVKQRLKG